MIKKINVDTTENLLQLLHIKLTFVIVCLGRVHLGQRGILHIQVFTLQV